MIYAYIRVSTDKQTVENQRFEIENFAKGNNLKIDKWITETASGTKAAKDRKLGPLLKKIKKKDILIVTEISRLGRNLMAIMNILYICMNRNVIVFTVKEKYELGNNINSQILAFAFGLSAQIERDLIAQRTKEALARKKAEGMKLGRPKGINKEKALKAVQLYLKNEDIEQICKKLNICKGTLYKYLNHYNIILRKYK